MLWSYYGLYKSIEKMWIYIGGSLCKQTFFRMICDFILSAITNLAKNGLISRNYYKITEVFSDVYKFLIEIFYKNVYPQINYMPTTKIICLSLKIICPSKYYMPDESWYIWKESCVSAFPQQYFVLIKKKWLLTFTVEAITLISWVTCTRKTA